MKKTLLVLVLIAVYLTPLEAQTVVMRRTTLDLETNPHSIALGESFVARSTPTSFFTNPAALPKISGFNFFYNVRNDNWFNPNDDDKFYTFGFSAAVPIGRLGFSFNKYKSNLILTSTENPDGIGTITNKTFLFSYANSIVDNFSIGASLKFFNFGVDPFPWIAKSFDSKTSIVIDIGMRYSFEKILPSYSATDNLSLGLSLQNFGTDSEFKLSPEQKLYYKNKLPRYLRAGFCYELNLLFFNDSENSDLDFFITGEYQRLLNPSSFDENYTDNLGVGFEMTALKIFSIRLGGIIPQDMMRIFNYEKLNWRYGAAVNMSLQKLGIDFPLDISIEYALIKIHSFDLTWIQLNKTNDKLHTYGLSVSYNSNLF